MITIVKLVTSSILRFATSFDKYDMKSEEAFYNCTHDIPIPYGRNEEETKPVQK